MSEAAQNAIKNRYDFVVLFDDFLHLGFNFFWV